MHTLVYGWFIIIYFQTDLLNFRDKFKLVSGSLAFISATRVDPSLEEKITGSRYNYNHSFGTLVSFR